MPLGRKLYRAQLFNQNETSITGSNKIKICRSTLRTFIQELRGALVFMEKLGFTYVQKLEIAMINVYNIIVLSSYLCIAI